jgi:hypothetical protein
LARTGICLAFTAFSVGVVLSLTLPAFGHAPSSFNAHDWENNKHQDLDVALDDSTPGQGSNWANRIDDAGDRWNEITSDALFFQNAQDLANGRNWNAQCHDPDSGGGGWEVVLFDNVNLSDANDVLAQTAICVRGTDGDIYYVEVGFDGTYQGNNRLWFKGPNPSLIGPNEWDLYGFAAHELGHAAGTWYGLPKHFSNSETFCDEGLIGGGDNDGYHTLCDELAISVTEWRTLETHDKHTSQNHY